MRIEIVVMICKSVTIMGLEYVITVDVFTMKLINIYNYVVITRISISLVGMENVVTVDLLYFYL